MGRNMSFLFSSRLRRYFNCITKSVNLKVLRLSSWTNLSSYIKWLEIEFFNNKKLNDLLRVIDTIEGQRAREILESNSQFGQELFVLAASNWKKGGYFVEFGAMDGVTASNTSLLERKYGWTGILAEPRLDCIDDLRKNRTSIVDNRAVWKMSNETVPFIFTSIEVGLSTLAIYKDSDLHAHARSSGQVYEVETVSLVDLLSQHEAPSEMDYLSIDTEGSELDILQAFDFERYKFRIITVEHNFNNSREKIKNLLESKGYTRVFEKHSNVEDWYILSELIFWNKNSNVT